MSLLLVLNNFIKTQFIVKSRDWESLYKVKTLFWTKQFLKFEVNHSWSQSNVKNINTFIHQIHDSKIKWTKINKQQHITTGRDVTKAIWLRSRQCKHITYSNLFIIHGELCSKRWEDWKWRRLLRSIIPASVSLFASFSVCLSCGLESAKMAKRIDVLFDPRNIDWCLHPHSERKGVRCGLFHTALADCFTFCCRALIGTQSVLLRTQSWAP